MGLPWGLPVFFAARQLLFCTAFACSLQRRTYTPTATEHNEHTLLSGRTGLALSTFVFLSGTYHRHTLLSRVVAEPETCVERIFFFTQIWRKAEVVVGNADH